MPPDPQRCSSHSLGRTEWLISPGNLRPPLSFSMKIDGFKKELPLCCAMLDARIAELLACSAASAWALPSAPPRFGAGPPPPGPPGGLPEAAPAPAAPSGLDSAGAGAQAACGERHQNGAAVPASARKQVRCFMWHASGVESIN